jgi:hypothetical protein
MDVTTMKREMARRGWNQVEMAKKAKISQSTVSSALMGYAIAGESALAIRQAFEKHSAKLDDLLEQLA